MHANIHTYIHIYINTYIHTYIHTYMHTDVPKPEQLEQVLDGFAVPKLHYARILANYTSTSLDYFMFPVGGCKA